MPCRNFREDFGSSVEFASEVSDLQCRYISGRTDAQFTLDFAKEHRINLYTAGQYAAIVHDIKRQTGFDLPLLLEVSNAAESAYDRFFSNEDLNFIAARNAEDMKLYRAVATLR